jgi:hypothetical protein
MQYRSQPGFSCSIRIAPFKEAGRRKIRLSPESNPVIETGLSRKQALLVAWRVLALSKHGLQRLDDFTQAYLLFTGLQKDVGNA